MALTITGISSMATRQVLAELTPRYRGATVSIESTGAVDAVRRVQAGEDFDLVVLADGLLGQLEAEGQVLAGSRVAFVRSPMALAVRTGAPWPDIRQEDTVRRALMEAATVGYSTGASGTHLLQVLKSWGLDSAAEPGRFILAKSGVPVAALIAEGKAEIGIQQLSELLDQPGIDIVGLLPPPVQSVTTFSIGIGIRSANVEHARHAIAFLNIPESVEAKRRFGLEPA